MKTRPEDSIHAIPNNEDHDPAFEYGMSKREYFAAQAMKAMIEEEDRPRNETYTGLAACAVQQADALIKELNRE